MESLPNIRYDIDCVIYHDPCQDGLSAAWVVYNWCKINNINLKLIPKRINNDPIDEKLYEGKNVLMVDIVSDDFQKIKEKAKTLVILDHHKTNQAKLVGIDYAYFDMHKSGVGLAWEYFYNDKEMPKFLACIQDRDIWTWKIQESKAFCDGFYNLMKNFGFFWTSAESNYNKAWLFYLTTNNNMISTDQLSKTIGASVRCIQD